MAGQENESFSRLLTEWRGGSEQALEALLPTVYDELRRLAGAQLRGERPDHTLQATALVNEALLRLVGEEIDWKDRAHLVGVTARVMRRVLVEHARGRNTAKRGGDRVRVTLSRAVASGPRIFDMIALDEALTELATKDPRQARVIELRYMGGLTHAEIAEAAGISEATVDRDLRHGRAWLKRMLKNDGA